MQKFSLKEIEYLEKDIAEIKACITRYIGYIVSVFGLIIFIGKYQIDESNKQYFVAFKPFTIILVLAALLVITFLFEIIWYKFKSHNRHVGYLHLLSQEIGAYKHILSKEDMKKLKKDSPETIKFYESAFLDNSNQYYVYNSEQLIPTDYKDEIHSFKFIMSRYNNTGSISDIDIVTKKTDRAWYCFEYPKEIGNETIHHSDVDRTNCLDKAFFENIIHKQYDDSKDKWWIRLWEGCKNILLLYFKDSSRNYRTRIQEKYLSRSWLYPRKLLQLGFIVFLGLSIFLFIVVAQNYDIKINCLDSWMSFGTAVIVIYLLILNRWITKYLFQIQDLTSGIGSIDYYCWAFFIYRVQYLNASNIIPKYYSRSFRRYYKSIFFSNWLEDILTKNYSISKGDKAYLIKIKTKYLKGESLKGLEIETHNYLKENISNIYKSDDLDKKELSIEDGNLLFTSKSTPMIE